MEHYETEMRSTHHLSRNTTSFYMRILRCVYRKAVGEGLALPADPFENVYTGVDKTSKSSCHPDRYQTHQAVGSFRSIIVGICTRYLSLFFLYARNVFYRSCLFAQKRSQ